MGRGDQPAMMHVMAKSSAWQLLRVLQVEHV